MQPPDPKNKGDPPLESRKQESIEIDGVRIEITWLRMSDQEETDFMAELRIVASYLLKHERKETNHG